MREYKIKINFKSLLYFTIDLVEQLNSLDSLVKMKLSEYSINLGYEFIF